MDELNAEVGLVIGSENLHSWILLLRLARQAQIFGLS